MSAHTEALRFWSEMGNRDYLPLLFIDQYQTLSEKYDDLFRFDQLNSEMETYLQDKLNYVTTLDEIKASFAEARDSQLAFWKGTYFLLDKKDDPDRFSILVLKDDNVEWEGQPITGYTFSAATLTFSTSIQLPGDSGPSTISANLAFSTPEIPPLGAGTGTTAPKAPDWLSQRSSFQRRCSGSVVLKGEKLQVDSKQGCYTPHGAKEESGSDPLDFWLGVYNAAIHTDGTVAYPAEGLVFGKADSTLTLNILGGIKIKEHQYFNNSLSWTNSDDSGQLILYRSFNGLRAMVGTITVGDQDSYVQAFFRRSSAAPATPVLHHAVARPALAAEPPAGEVKITTTSIPAGVSNRDYPMQSLAASGGLGTYTWTVQGLPGGLALSSDGKLTGIPTSSPGSYDFYVTATDTSSPQKSAKATLTLKLVEQLKITTTSLPDAISDQQYTAYLNAQGGDPKTYAWKITPENAKIDTDGKLTLDDKTGCISGKPSVPAGKDNVASFGVKVTSTVSGVALENETHLTIKMIAVFSPTLILSIITGALGLLVGTGVIFKFLELRQKAKEAAEKAKKDPSDKESLQEEVESVTAENDLLIEEGAKKSRVAERNFKDVPNTVEEAVSRFRTDINNNLRTTLDRMGSALGDVFRQEQERRRNDMRSLETQIDGFRTAIQNTVDKAVREQLEASQRQLEQRVKEVQKQMQELERTRSEEKKEEEKAKETLNEGESIGEI